MNFIVLDFETATESRASACEVGLCVVENNEIVSSKSWLIKPPQNKYLYANISIHGITPDMTEDSKEFPEVWKEVCEIINGKDVIAHYSPFDMGVIRDECALYNLDYPEFRFMCSCSLSRFIKPGLPSYALSSLCRHFEINSDVYHRAEYDSIMTAKLFLKLLEMSDCNSFDEICDKYEYQLGLFGKELYVPFKRIHHKNAPRKVDLFLKDFEYDPSIFIDENPFTGKTVVFTGKMNMQRVDLLKIVANIGGIPSDNIKKTTDFLVVGQQDFRIVGDDGMSSKQEKAVKWIEQGCGITILSEAEFMQMISGLV